MSRYWHFILALEFSLLGVLFHLSLTIRYTNVSSPIDFLPTASPFYSAGLSIFPKNCHCYSLCMLNKVLVNFCFVLFLCYSETKNILGNPQTTKFYFCESLLGHRRVSSLTKQGLRISSFYCRRTRNSVACQSVHDLTLCAIKACACHPTTGFPPASGPHPSSAKFTPPLCCHAVNASWPTLISSVWWWGAHVRRGRGRT